MKTGLVAAAAICSLMLAGCATTGNKKIPCLEKQRPEGAPVEVKILAINDFHGQLPAGLKLNGRPAGGAEALASYIKAESAKAGLNRTIIALVGDQVGTSPPESGLLLDEPAILFFNMLANGCCTTSTTASKTGCNLVATSGNHDFDMGTDEFIRKIEGGNGKVFVEHMVDPYPGALSEYVCSNIKWIDGGKKVLAPYAVREVDGVRIAFIGTVTTSTPAIVLTDNVQKLKFEEEAASINRVVSEIRKKGINAIVVMLHEGGRQTAYEGPTAAGGDLSGPVTEIIKKLDGAVDIVLTGHTHAFTNTFVPNSAGKPVLVTQAWSQGVALADIDITLDPATGAIVKKSASIVPTWSDQPPGDKPDAETHAFMKKCNNIVGNMSAREVNLSDAPITREPNSLGESALGDLLVDSRKAVLEADVAFLTTGSLRSDLPAGKITYGILYAAQPFGDILFRVRITGRQIQSIIEQQWTVGMRHNLAAAGIRYTYDPAAAPGAKICEVTVNGKPLDPNATYTAVIDDYLQTGGDGYAAFTECPVDTVGQLDIDMLAGFIGSMQSPIKAVTDGRIGRCKK